MFYLTDICLLCLSSKQLKSVLLQNGNGIAVEEELKYCLPEITISKSGIQDFICSSCQTAVHSFYKFKKKCLKNYGRLLQYTGILQGSSDLRDQKLLKIQINTQDFMIEREQNVYSALNINVNIEDSFHSLENHKQRTANIDDKEDDLICTELQKQLNNQEFIRAREQEVDSKLNIKIDHQVSLQSLNEGDHKPVLGDEFELKDEFVASEGSDDHEFYLKYLKNYSAAENEQDSASTSSSEDGNQSNVNEADFRADIDNANREEYKHKDSSASNEKTGPALPTFVNTSKTISKRYFCIFCKNPVTKLPRHLLHSHKDEIDVKKLQILPKGCLERKEILDRLRKLGIYQYNTNAAYNNGDLMVSRRPNVTKQRDPKHYIPCPHCKNYYSKLTLYRHVRRCSPVRRGSRRIEKRIQTTL